MAIALAAQRGQVPSAPDVSQLVETLEKQPACLMRIALDGTLLAANDVALSLLRATSLDEVLEQSFVSRFLPGQGAMWDEFASRVWTSGSGSAECELTDGHGTRPVQLNAVARRDHPDGIDSLFLTVRDATATRRLEEAVREAARIQALATEQQRELQQARVEFARLSARLHEAAREQASARDRAEAREQDVESLRAEIARLSRALQDATTDIAQAQMLADDHERALEAARAEADRLAAERQEALDECESLAARLAEADTASSEIAALRESLRGLSPLAATGRLARQLSLELEERMRTLEDHARTVLALGAGSAAQREMLEALQKEAVEAALLVQQLSDAGRIASRRS